MVSTSGGPGLPGSGGPVEIIVAVLVIAGVIWLIKSWLS